MPSTWTNFRLTVSPTFRPVGHSHPCERLELIPRAEPRGVGVMMCCRLPRMSRDSTTNHSSTYLRSEFYEAILAYNEDRLANHHQVETVVTLCGSLFSESNDENFSSRTTYSSTRCRLYTEVLSRKRYTSYRYMAWHRCSNMKAAEFWG